jgi:thymidylate synthase
MLQLIVNCIRYNNVYGIILANLSNTSGGVIITDLSPVDLPSLPNREIFRIIPTGEGLALTLKSVRACFPDKQVYIVGTASLYNLCLSESFIYEIDKLTLYLTTNDTKVPPLQTFMFNQFEWTISSIVRVPSDFNNSPETVEYILHYEPTGEFRYLSILHNVLTNGVERLTRNGIVKSSFFDLLYFDLQAGFPILTTKKMFFKGIVEELLFFLRGETDCHKLDNKGVTIWQKNTDRSFLNQQGFFDRTDGLMGPMYGYQWRHFNAKYDEKTGTNLEPGIDQLKKVIEEIKKDPMSRRLLMTTFNPVQADEGVLYPCHSLIVQFYVRDESTSRASNASDRKYLDMFTYNRSQDLFLGVPFNISSSALLLHIIARLCNLLPGHLHIAMGDIHIYKEHYEPVKMQLARQRFKFPKLVLPAIENADDINKLEYKDFNLINYQSHANIKAQMVA